MPECRASVSGVVPPLHQYRRAQTPGARSSWRLKFIRWRLIFVGPQYGTCLILPFWPAEFRDRFQIFGKFVHQLLCIVFQRIVVLIVLQQQPQISPWFFVLPLMLQTKIYTHTIHVKFYFVSFIPCIIDNRFTSLNQQNAHTFSLDTLYYIALNITKCFGPQGTIIRERSQSNAAQNQISHICVQPTWCRRLTWC